MLDLARLGAPVNRLEDDSLLRGTAAFLADLLPGATLHAAFVRSSVPAARITSIDTAAARDHDGVLLVLTGREIAADVQRIAPVSRLNERFAHELNILDRPAPVECLAVEEVRYVGEPVAVVVAVDRYTAEDAAQLVGVVYDVLPAVLDADQALADSARPVHREHEDNIAVRMSYKKGRPTADDDELVVVEGTYDIARQTALSLECRGVSACPQPDGRMDIWSSTQVPFIVRNVVCQTLGWEAHKVRVRVPEVGGAFGPKAVVYGEEVIVPYVARRLGKAVTWVEDRYENLTSAAQARDQVHRTRLTMHKDGRIHSWEDDFVVDLGVHNLWMVGVVANTAIHLLGPYRIPAVRVSGTAVFTNKAPTSQYRGAGRPEATFALERSIDQAADRLGMSRTELRDLNLLGPGDLPYEQGIPYRDGVDIVYDGQDYRRVLHGALALLPDTEVSALAQQAKEDVRVGFGVATYMEATARGPYEAEAARVGLGPDGRLYVRGASGPSGQSHRTMFAQVAAATAQVPIDNVDAFTGDTDAVPHGLGSFASRTAVITGSAVRIATEGVINLAAKTVRDVRGVASVDHGNGGFVLPGGENVSWKDIAGWFAVGGPMHGESAIEVIESFAPRTVTWTMGVHVVAVAVDTGTGAVQVLRYGVAHESGPAINPRVVDGQIRGGVVQGIGGALLEEVRYDDQGQPTTVTLADYLVPESGDVPAVRLAHFDAPSKLNPLQIRGVGESGIIAGGAAIASAVEDALTGTGIRVAQTPVSADALLAWLEEDAS